MHGPRKFFAVVPSLSVHFSLSLFIPPKSASIGFHGNVVDIWERFVKEDDMLVELGSDQTSCHNPFNGGYYPVQLGFREAQEVRLGRDSTDALV